MTKITNLKKLTITSACIALCVILPLIFHAIPNGGSIFSPMHIPVLLCGLICGWHYGLACGLLGPLVSSMITSMPPAAFLLPMMVELGLYGLIAGLVMQIIRTKKLYLDLYISLITAMLIGRIFTGLAMYLFFRQGDYAISLWFTSYFVTSLPGILVHLILIPLIVVALTKASIIPERYIKERK